MSLKKVAARMHVEAKKRGVSRRVLNRGLALNLWYRDEDIVLGLRRRVVTMNVEKITALEQIKSTLGIAYKSAERQLRDPFSDPISISTYLLTRLHVVSQDIDDMIKDEEDALEAYYQEVQQATDA